MMLNKIVNSKYTFYALMSAYIFYLWDSDGKYGFSPTDEARILVILKNLLW